MPNYIFSEEEWLDFSEGYSDATLVGIADRRYGLIIHRALKSPLPGSSTSDRFLGVNTFGPGGVYESHAHETPMFYYVLSGRGKMRVGDEERIVERGLSSLPVHESLRASDVNAGRDLTLYRRFRIDPPRFLPFRPLWFPIPLTIGEWRS